MIRRVVLSAIVLAAGIASVSGQQPASAAPGGPNGELLFRQRCAACHSAARGVNKPMAPNLAGVVGRKAAAATFNYSPALKSSNLTWTQPNLDRYLASPMRTVPGTKMVIAVSDPAQRAALIDYLAKTR